MSITLPIALTRLLEYMSIINFSLNILTHMTTMRRVGSLQFTFVYYNLHNLFFFSPLSKTSLLIMPDEPNWRNFDEHSLGGRETFFSPLSPTGGTTNSFFLYLEDPSWHPWAPPALIGTPPSWRGPWRFDDVMDIP